MKIEIRNRFTGSIIISGEYESIKDCLGKNSGSNLRGSNLSYSNLSYSNLRGSNLSYSNLRYSDLRGSNLSYSNLRYSDLRDSDLRYSDLRGSNLSYSNLSYSDLRDSDLRYAKNYRDSRDIFVEAVRQQLVSVFIDAEWNAIAQITIHRLCWDSIKKRFSDVMPHIFEILANAGFGEWLEYWNKL